MSTAANERYELMKGEARKVNRAWKEAHDQLEAARSFLTGLNEDADEALLRMRIDRALECLASSPAQGPNA